MYLVSNKVLVMTLIKPLNLTMTDTICQYELNPERTYFVYFKLEAWPALPKDFEKNGNRISTLTSLQLEIATTDNKLKIQFNFGGFTIFLVFSNINGRNMKTFDMNISNFSFFHDCMSSAMGKNILSLFTKWKILMKCFQVK